MNKQNQTNNINNQEYVHKNSDISRKPDHISSSVQDYREKLGELKRTKFYDKMTMGIGALTLMASGGYIEDGKIKEGAIMLGVAAGSWLHSSKAIKPDIRKQQYDLNISRKVLRGR